MAQPGFFEQKPARPLSFGVVVLLHGAAIGALILMKGPGWIIPDKPPLLVEAIPIDKPPPPEPLPEPDKQMPPAPSISRMDVPPRVIPTPVPTISSESIRILPGPLIGPNPNPSPAAELPSRPLPEATVPVERPAPVRVEALFDPRFARELQPPYPVGEERAEREGDVRIRVTIGADGRVKAAQKISATTDAFWRNTERHALSRWRFRPATVDGRPVESSKVLNVRFRLDGR